MKSFVFLCLCFQLSLPLYAKNSRLIPMVLESARIHSHQSELKTSSLLRKEFVLILNLFEQHKLDAATLARWTRFPAQGPWRLPSKDRYALEKLNVLSDDSEKSPPISLHLSRLKVIEESDDVLNDDLYLFFFLTDGVVPTGKVTGIYKGLDEGDTLVFNPSDRVIYPAGGGAKSPHRHLIVDYGIIESDGDDIGELRKISAFITDLAVSIYEASQSENSGLDHDLRREVKALADLLLERNDDDRLVNGSFVLTSSELMRMLLSSNYVEFSLRHVQRTTFDDFNYKLYFRVFKQ